MDNLGTRREGSAVFMYGESGEGQCRPTLPDLGDAKPGGADTSTQITIVIINIVYVVRNFYSYKE